MRVVKKRRVYRGRTRHVTLEMLHPLREKGQIFYGAATQTLAAVVHNGLLRTFERGEVVFEQGQRTDNLPVFCVLSGRFRVTHIWGKNQPHIATDSAGALIGEVELTLRGETMDHEEELLRGLSTDQTWARVQCVSRGEVLSIWPPDFLLEDRAVAVALARSLARKLLLRSAVADPKTFLPKPKQVELFLRRVARDMALGDLDSPDPIELPLSLADVAEEVECAKQTVAVALKELAGRYEGFDHQRSLIVVPRRFLRDPLDLFDGPPAS